jgi:hypothetical protein
MGFFSGIGDFISDVVSAPVKAVGSLLGGGSSAQGGTATANSNINFEPTTTINFDTDALANAYLDGSKDISNSILSSTQSQMNLDKSIASTALKQEENLFNRSYTQTEDLHNKTIQNDTQLSKNELELRAKGLQLEALQFGEILKMNESKKKQFTAFFIIGAGIYLYGTRKKR